MNLFIYGSGGIGCEMVDITARINSARKRWKKIRFVDDIRTDREHYKTEVFRFDEMLAEDKAFECVIALGEPAHRRMLYEKLTQHGIRLATVIDESANISPSADIADGCIIGPNSFVSSHTRLCANVMLEIQTIIGHDIVIGSHSVISSCTVVGGKTVIGEESFVGLNASIKEGVRIGNRCIVGMSSSVFGNIEDGLIALGNPARALRKNEELRVFKN